MPGTLDAGGAWWPAAARGRPLSATLVAGRAIGRPAQSDAPGAFSNLELAQAGRAQLGHEGGQQSLGEAVDRGMVGRPLGWGALRAAGVRRGGLGHALDLLAGRRLVARP